jgi:hypothetical protein
VAHILNHCRLPSYGSGKGPDDRTGSANFTRKVVEIIGGIGPDFRHAAFFIATRAGAVSQQGPKLVGTGAVGLAEQGYSVALSGDSNTAIVGGLSDNSGTGPCGSLPKTLSAPAEERQTPSEANRIRFLAHKRPTAM